ncbi:MAG: TonB-dependent receptor plug domain-containing protein [Bacteroidota bacterium]|nr:TonB-dependent receptor plug domain-containing protein [Bacteroidota bacterium]
MFRILIILTVIIGGFSSFACAQRSTISGQIVDAQSGEYLISAHVFTDGLSVLGTTSNNYGFFSLEVPEGPVQISASFVGYNLWQKLIEVKEDTSFIIALEPIESFEEISIIGNKSGNRISTSIHSITPKMIQFLPTLAGEKGIIRLIQLLPGIQAGAEGTAGLVVRGGSPDQNLYLLDGCPLYNISHLYGFLSVFNEDAINSVNVIKGGYPARYGGRLSSVIDIRMKEGNLYKHEGSLSVGLISAKISANGPLINGKASYMFSSRRSYFDLFTSIPAWLSNTKTNKHISGYSLADLNGKVNFILSPKDRIYFSFYYGMDTYSEKRFSENDTVPLFWENHSKLKWGNTLASIRWNHTYSKKLFGNTQISWSKYNLISETGYLREEGQKEDWSKVGYQSEYYSRISEFALAKPLLHGTDELEFQTGG